MIFDLYMYKDKVNKIRINEKELIVNFILKIKEKETSTTTAFRPIYKV